MHPSTLQEKDAYHKPYKNIQDEIIYKHYTNASKLPVTYVVQR